jgi:hypothetical protein
MWLAGVTCRGCHVFRANLLKPDLCEVSNCWHEPQVFSDAKLFFEERLLIQVEWACLLQNNLCSFWYHLGVCRQHRSRSSSIWL